MSAALAILNLGGGTGSGAGPSYEEHSTEGDSLVPPPTDWQQLGPVLAPEQFAPLPVMMSVAPESPIISDDIIESVVRAVVTPLP